MIGSAWAAAWARTRCERTDLDKALQKSYATVWESFDCNGKNLGPCAIPEDPLFPPPITPANQPDFMNQFCSGRTYFPGQSDPPEWKAIRGQYDAAQVFGVVNEAHMADIDNGLTHRTHNATCPKMRKSLAWSSAFWWHLGAEGWAKIGSLVCASDFEFFVRPMDRRSSLPPSCQVCLARRIRLSSRPSMKWRTQLRLHELPGGAAPWRPLAHDRPLDRRLRALALQNGTSSALQVFARANTVFTETNPFTGLEEPLFGGKPATRVAIWVNGWYQGAMTTLSSTTSVPAAQTLPNRLASRREAGGSRRRQLAAAQDVTLNYSIGPAGSATKVHLRFTATRRENPVTQEGEMLFEPGRQSWEIWYLYWGD